MTGPLSKTGWAGQGPKSSLKPFMCSQLCGLLLIQSTMVHLGVLSVLSFRITHREFGFLEFSNVSTNYQLVHHSLSFILGFFLCLFPSGLPAPLPSLEWPLPSQSGQYELLIQQQPKSHHRAHYETEGSRGAVKTSNGGHPEIQVNFFFILCRQSVGRERKEK